MGGTSTRRRAHRRPTPRSTPWTAPRSRCRCRRDARCAPARRSSRDRRRCGRHFRGGVLRRQRHRQVVRRVRRPQVGQLHRPGNRVLPVARAAVFTGLQSTLKIGTHAAETTLTAPGPAPLEAVPQDRRRRLHPRRHRPEGRAGPERLVRPTGTVSRDYFGQDRVEDLSRPPPDVAELVVHRGLIGGRHLLQGHVRRARGDLRAEGADRQRPEGAHVGLVVEAVRRRLGEPADGDHHHHRHGAVGGLAWDSTAPSGTSSSPTSGADYPLDLNALTKREEIDVAKKTGLDRAGFVEGGSSPTTRRPPSPGVACAAPRPRRLRPRPTPRWTCRRSAIGSGFADEAARGGWRSRSRRGGPHRGPADRIDGRRLEDRGPRLEPYFRWAFRLDLDAMLDLPCDRWEDHRAWCEQLMKATMAAGGPSGV